MKSMSIRQGRFWRRFALSAALLSAPLLAATPADQVKIRVDGLKALGAAFKTVNDTLRSGSAPAGQLQRAADQIESASRAQYRWFPAGSGPSAGVKTAAKPEIWSRAGEFRAAQDNFARQAGVFKRAVASGNQTAVQAEVRRLGGTCKACHDNFRVAKD
jgi:cytochrome c556